MQLIMPLPVEQEVLPLQDYFWHNFAEIWYDGYFYEYSIDKSNYEPIDHATSCSTGSTCTLGLFMEWFCWTLVFWVFLCIEFWNCHNKAIDHDISWSTGSTWNVGLIMVNILSRVLCDCSFSFDFWNGCDLSLLFLLLKCRHFHYL